MDTHDSTSTRGLLAWPRSALPGLAAWVGVLVLLRGFSGTAEALSLQVSTLAESFLGGGGEELMQVLLWTLPLAIASAIATFAIASRWLTFESFSSVIALAGIVLVGAAVGGFLREMVHDRSLPKDGAMPTPLAGQVVGNSFVLGHSVVAAPVRPSAIEQLQGIDWLAEPNLENAPPASIPPLNVLPKSSGVLGIVLMAINQLLGYLVAYQPRLFLAAILSGGWIGWNWQRRLNSWQTNVLEYGDGAPTISKRRRAA